MTDSLRALFDAYWWERGSAANRSVQRELIAAWVRCFPDDEIIVAVRSADAPTDLPPAARTVRTRLWPHGLSNAVELGRHAARERADIIVAHNYTPLRGASATFIHDVMFTENPEWFSRGERAYFAGMLPLVRHARVIATSSRTEAARIENHRRGTAPVVAIGIGAPTALTHATPRMPAEAEGLDEFALAVGRLNIRKNLGAVISGAARSGRISPATPLLVVGSAEHSGVGADLPADVVELVREGTVRFTGRIDDAELAWLYGHTALFISMSRDEGFGMPPVEATWFGAPVLASDIAVHRETVGGTARFVSPAATPEEVGSAIDAAWGARPSQAAVDALRTTYDWDASARRLRQAVADSMGYGASPQDS